MKLMKAMAQMKALNVWKNSTCEAIRGAARRRAIAALPTANPAANPLLAAALVFMMATAMINGAQAHHILGTPHYAYDEQYPQTPVLTYRVAAGRYDVRMTGYPGNPKPGEQWALNVYIVDEAGELFDDKVKVTVAHKPMFGEGDVIYGPMEARLEEAVYKFYPRFDAEGNFQVELSFQGDDEEWVIALPVVIGTPRSAASILAIGGVGFLVLFVVGRAILIKVRRRKRLGNPRNKPSDLPKSTLPRGAKSPG